MTTPSHPSTILGMRSSVLSSGVPLMMALVCSITLSYLAWLRRERFLLWWLIAWGFLLTRLSWHLFLPASAPTDGAVFLAALLRIAFAGSLLAGALELRGRRATWWAVPLAALAVPTLIVITTRLGLLPRVPQSLVAMTVIVLAAAWQVAKSARLPIQERTITAVAIAIHGIAAGISPRLDDADVLFSVVTLVGWTAQLMIGFGMLAAFFRIANEREIAEARAIGASLTTALGSFVAVCMHCKSVRDHSQAWQPLEYYAAQKSGTAISHGLCPNCEEAHYPEYR